MPKSTLPPSEFINTRIHDGRTTFSRKSNSSLKREALSSVIRPKKRIVATSSAFASPTTYCKLFISIHFVFIKNSPKKFKRFKTSGYKRESPGLLKSGTSLSITGFLLFILSFPPPEAYQAFPLQASQKCSLPHNPVQDVFCVRPYRVRERPYGL